MSAAIEVLERSLRGRQETEGDLIKCIEHMERNLGGHRESLAKAIAERVEIEQALALLKDHNA